MALLVQNFLNGYNDVMENKSGGLKQYILLTHTDNLLYLQLHTVQSTYTVHTANPC
jgi:hypothetical protein